MPDLCGPGWPVGANRPPAGRMTRDGRLGSSPAPGAFAGRPAAGGLCPGTVAHLREGRRRFGEVRHYRPTASDRVSGIWGSRQILSDVAHQVWCKSKLKNSHYGFPSP